MRLIRLVALSGVILLASVAHARDALPPADGISVTDAWARATAGASTSGAVYLTITETAAADRLTGAGTPIAAGASLHQSKSENGIMKMLSVESLDVAAGAPVRFAPGGYHIMLTGLKQPLKSGDQFPLTLTFAHAGAITITVAVHALGADDAKPMNGMDMGHM